MDVIYKEDISNDFLQLFESENDYNVIIYAGEGSNIKELHAHSIILRRRSQYFEKAFSYDWTEKKNGMFILKKPNISGSVFNIILKYLYSGIIELFQLEASELIPLLIAADELALDRIINYIQEYLIKHHEKYLKNDSIGILQKICQYETFTELIDHCLEIICLEPKILDSEGLFSLSTPILELLFGREELCMDEVIIWEKLIKWSFTQNSTVNQDVTKWSQDDIDAMKKTMSRFIPLIRFYDITSRDFNNKVLPYKQLLPSDLMWNIISYHLDPNSHQLITQPPRNEINSLFVDQKIALTLASWVDHKEELYTERQRIPHVFKLLYRNSKDGQSTESFHNHCDFKGATLVIAKVKNSNKLIGGYSPFEWDKSGKHKFSKEKVLESFVFSFANFKDRNTGKVGRLYHPDNKSIFCSSIDGPTFGKGPDIVCRQDGSWESNPCSYICPHIPNKFSVEDYEVFQVIKKLTS